MRLYRRPIEQRRIPGCSVCAAVDVNQALGLTIFNTAPAEYGLKVPLAWWIPGMLLALAYTICVYRRFAGKVRGAGSLTLIAAAIRGIAWA